ncbi:MAG TPA: fibrobacter succinogenes major paralogous domain-containing protein [Bacteroidales bacterium]|nr:fibrobacter succinogenes major paralogous domain-containing protein [Bacteroidales bacterium]
MKYLFIPVLFILLNAGKPVTGQAIRDVDGNYYSSVGIGSQIWLAENLKTTRFNDGTLIPLVTDEKKWKEMRSPAYCWLENNESNKNIYGALYNWYAVKTNKLCPKGWHVPSAGEWDMMVAQLGGEKIAGEKLKEEGNEHWKGSFSTSTNEYGFTALPGGMRFESGNFPVFSKSYGVWWTTSSYSTYYAWNRGMYFSNGNIYRGHDNVRNGYSVRCIKD